MRLITAPFVLPFYLRFLHSKKDVRYATTAHFLVSRNGLGWDSNVSIYCTKSCATSCNKTCWYNLMCICCAFAAAAAQLVLQQTHNQEKLIWVRILTIVETGEGHVRWRVEDASVDGVDSRRCYTVRIVIHRIVRLIVTSAVKACQSECIAQQPIQQNA